MTAKELLLHITRTAYRHEEMALLCGVFPWKWDPKAMDLVPDPARNLTDHVARQKAEPDGWTILDILRHVADCKATYIVEAFGEPPQPFPPAGDSLQATLAYLEAAQAYLVACLTAIDDEALDRAVPSSSHGDTAANLFWVMAQHDVDHGSHIVSLRQLVEG